MTRKIYYPFFKSFLYLQVRIFFENAFLVAAILSILLLSYLHIHHVNPIQERRCLVEFLKNDSVDLFIKSDLVQLLILDEIRNESSAMENRLFSSASSRISSHNSCGTNEECLNSFALFNFASSFPVFFSSTNKFNFIGIMESIGTTVFESMLEQTNVFFFSCLFSAWNRPIYSKSGSDV